MFEAKVYQSRRSTLLGKMKAAGQSGLAIFLGNVDAPQNYRGNDYKFRQDSTFLYYWGIDEPRFAAVLDLDSGAECIFADDVDIDDIIWMGPQPSVQSKAALTGAAGSATYADFSACVTKARAQGREVHYLPVSRYYNAMMIRNLLPGVDPSLALTKAVISMRLVKDSLELEELDKAGEIGYLMHTEARRGCKPGTPEQEIVGRMEGVTLSKGWGVSFTTILSQHGETLHNHAHGDIITPGRLLLIDAGAESNTHYASDYTRTYPSSGNFTPMQKDVYDIVEACNALAFSLVRPGVTYYDTHIAVARRMLEGLSGIGLVSGSIDDMVSEGIAGLFMPHGLGHNMGLDVHDMEDLGEDYVGYDDDQRRSPQLGLGSLRMARRLRPGNVITIEPGIYFVPALIAKWKEEGTDKGFVNYSKLEQYYEFGGIRLEDDVVITSDSVRYLGFRRLPIKSAEVEEIMAAE